VGAGRTLTYEVVHSIHCRGLCFRFYPTTGRFRRVRFTPALGFAGKKDLVNPTLQKKASKLDDFEMIKYVTGIRFHSLASVTTTLGWLKKHEIGLEEIIRVRAYFDPKEISLRKPNLKVHRFVSKMAMCFFLAPALLVFVVGYAPAWFS